jgi:hypothetical protein
MTNSSLLLSLICDSPAACGERIRVRVEVPIHGMFFIISGLIGIMFVFR